MPSNLRRTRAPGEVWMLLKDRKLLARLLAIQGHSARWLAKESGFRSHTYVLRMLRGEVRSCTAERAVAIAANLQVPLDSLFVSNVSSVAGQTVQQTAPPFRSGRAAKGNGTPVARPSRRRPATAPRGAVDTTAEPAAVTA